MRSDLQPLPSTQAPLPETDFSSSEVYRWVVEQASEAVILADLGGVIRVWNTGAQNLFGFSPAEAIGASLDLIIPERFRRAHWDGFDRAIRNGHTRLGSQVRTTRAVHRDGRKLYVDLSFGLVADAAGKVVGALAIGRDGTSRYLEERALRDKLPSARPSAPSV